MTIGSLTASQKNKCKNIDFAMLVLYNIRNGGDKMKTYTVTQKGGYQILRTTDKEEAEKKLAELLKYSKSWYICEQGYDDN